MPKDGRSRPPRVSTSIPAVLIDGDGGRVPVVVTDLSSGGFRLQTRQALVPGEVVRINVESGQSYPAEIQWASRGEAGGCFLEPVRLVDGIPT